MVDILISNNGFGSATYKRIGNYNTKYMTLDNLEKLGGNRYDFMHFCVEYDKRYFYLLKQCIDMCDRVKSIVIHNMVGYDDLIDTQQLIDLPIFYMPHSDIDNEWIWSMIGVMNDKLIIEFENSLGNISNKYCKMIGL